MIELIKAHFLPLTGGLTGLILAILIITIGFFNTLVVLIFMVLGITIGCCLEKTGLLSNLFK